jgi:glycosyltransferase involved in cell wall biosynthesis
MNTEKKLSVVVPVYNEQENLPELNRRLIDALGFLNNALEIIYVDDGSNDNTWNEISKACMSEQRCKGIRFSNNYGQSSAISAGIKMANGRYIATIDGDLQNDPYDIPKLLEIAQTQDWDVVAGERVSRKDKVVSRKLPSRIANFLIRITTGVKLRDYGCTLRVFRSDIAKNLGLYGELHRFIPVLAVLQGASTRQIPVNHQPRQFGKSKYGINRTFKVMSDLILMLFFQKYMQRPMHIFGTAGLFVLITGVIINLYLAVLKAMGQDIWGKPLLILGAILVIGGIQLITVGILAEVLMRTYYESQRKLPYRVKEMLNEEKQPSEVSKTFS